MPHFWNNTNKVAVLVDELVPMFWSSKGSLSVYICRNKNTDYGVKVLQKPCRGRKLLIDFDSLPCKVKNLLEDPRKIQHNLQDYYITDSDAVDFYTMFKRIDGNYLLPIEQQRYITNASVMIAILKLKQRYIEERINENRSIKGIYNVLCSESNSFNNYLERKKMPQHNLPTNSIRFKEALNKFENEFMYNGKLYQYNYLSVIKDVEGKRKNNSLKVNEKVLQILNGLFITQSHKPTPTDIYRAYKAFLKGNAEVYNENTGEIFNPKEFPNLSESTVKLYLSKWENAIVAHKKRSGNRQSFINKYKPHHQLERPKFSGSIISIDDRNPPFKDLNGKRIWFYNGIDLASECFTVFVYGKTKEGIIIEFYRQMLRNYTEWGLSIPYELEAESSLNSNFTNTFLQNGYMFGNVRIESNNARGKRIERYFKTLRYDIEKKREGWLARPNARLESNQISQNKIPSISYDEIIENCIDDIFEWNNAPHSKEPTLTRWEYLLKMQNPELKPTNWKAILPYLGFKTQTSCNTGYINLQGEKRALAIDNQICLGKTLINLLKKIEGKNIDVYWIDDNKGNVLKALVYFQERFICEVIEMPKYNRAKIERTHNCEKAREIQSSYVATVESFIKKQEKALQKINIIHNTKEQPVNGFFIPGIDRKKIVASSANTVETLEIIDEETNSFHAPSVSWHQAFQ